MTGCKMAYTGSEVFMLGVGVTFFGALLSFVVVSLVLSASRNTRRAALVEARRLQGIPDAIVVEEDEDEKRDIESGEVVAESATVATTDESAGSTTTKRKETAEDKRKKKLKNMLIPVGEIYDAAYGKRERTPGLCYSIFTRKSTVLMHLSWTKAISCVLLVLQCAFLGISMARGLYLLAFPQYGVASVAVSFFMAMYSLNQEATCCLRWCVLTFFIPVVVAVDLLDAATLAVEYVCKRDGSPCSYFSAEVVLFFFCLRMISFFLTIWVAMLTSYLSHELGCCDDQEVYSYWDLSWDTKKVTLDCTRHKDFPRHRGKSLQQAIRRRKEEIRLQQEKKDAAEAGGDSGQSDEKKAAFVSALAVAGGFRRAKKSVFRQRSPSGDGNDGGLLSGSSTPSRRNLRAVRRSVLVSLAATMYIHTYNMCSIEVSSDAPVPARLGWHDNRDCQLTLALISFFVVAGSLVAVLLLELGFGSCAK